MSQSPDEPTWPFQSLWSRLALAVTALGAGASITAFIMVFSGLFTRLPGGDAALARAPLPPVAAGSQVVLDLALRAGDSLDIWELQRPPVRGQGADYSLVVRAPTGEDLGLVRVGSAHVATSDRRAEHRGTFQAQQTGKHVVEATVRWLPKDHELTLAVHRPGTVGPETRWFEILLVGGLMVGFGTLVCALEFTRWFLQRLKAS